MLPLACGRWGFLHQPQFGVQALDVISLNSESLFVVFETVCRFFSFRLLSEKVCSHIEAMSRRWMTSHPAHPTERPAE